MSKVDMSVFEELFAALGVESSARVYYELFDAKDSRWSDELSSGKETPEEVESILKTFDCERKIEGEYGGEGEGEHCFGIIKLKGNYYRASWSYYSYNGCEYSYIEDTIEEVEPFEQTVTMYRSVK